MISFSLERAKNILCLGAHSDDLEIGIGATILKLLSKRKDLVVSWVVFTADGKRDAEAKASAQKMLAHANKSSIIVKQFRNGYFPFEGEAIKNFFEELKSDVRPDLVFTHYRNDRHQDHRVISDFTWNTFRNHLILEYEIPKYDGDLGCPNVFVPINQRLAQTKVDHLLKFFPTQAERHWFDREMFFGLMRVRGVECATTYAEAFYARKIACG